MQKDCKHCRESLWGYITHELSFNESKKIEEHLQDCPSCKQEAERIKLLVSALHEEIPLPADFTENLHQKLSRAAEEMAAKTPARRKLPRRGSFKTLVPALACLALVIGVFSSGLYDQWQNADQILTNPPVESSTPIESSAPVETKTPAGSSASAPTVTNPVTPVEPVPTTETAPVTDTPEVASGENTPAVASVDTEEIPAGFSIPRQTDKVTCLTLFDSHAFLESWQEVSGYDWETYLVETNPRELLPGVTDDTAVLQLPKDAFDSLLAFEEALSITQTGLAEEKTEFLIIITKDEE